MSRDTNLSMCGCMWRNGQIDWACMPHQKWASQQLKSMAMDDNGGHPTLFIEPKTDNDGTELTLFVGSASQRFTRVRVRIQARRVTVETEGGV